MALEKDVKQIKAWAKELTTFQERLLSLASNNTELPVKVKVIAAEMGFTDTRTIQNWIKEGIIPCHILGRTKLVYRSDVIKAMEKRNQGIVNLSIV